MIEVKDGICFIPRGDSGELTLTIDGDDGIEYEMREGDRLVLDVAQFTGSEEPLIRIESSTPTFVFSCEDTEGMEVGAYSVDINLYPAAGGRHKVWPPQKEDTKPKKNVNWANFIITPEVVR